MTKLIYFLCPIVALVVVVTKLYERKVESEYMATMAEAQARLDKMIVDNYNNGLKREADEDKRRKSGKRNKKSKKAGKSK